MPQGARRNDVALRAYREWVAIHLMQRALERYDQGHRETMSNGLTEHVALEEFRQLWRKLRR